MTLPVKNFQQFVSDLNLQWQNAIDAIAGFIPALQEGDALYAAFQSVSAQLVFIQAQIQIVNAIARAQTSTGPDLDSFYAQFNFPRLEATFLRGNETYSRLVASPTQVLIPPGALVQTPGGAIQYEVIGDTTQGEWNPTLNAYVLAPNATSVTVTVQALVGGTSYAVASGQLSQQTGTGVAGIDSVTNPSSISSATGTETDAAYRARFVLYLQALSKATQAAILYAIQSIEPGLFINLLENENPEGATQLGAFTAVVDDGTGVPPASLINTAYAAAYAARGFTIQPYVVAPTVVTPTISLNIRVLPSFIAGGGTTLEAENNAQAAIVVGVNQIEPSPNETALFVSAIEAMALTGVGVEAVEPGATLINSANADLPLTQFDAPRITSSNVTIGSY